MTESYEFPEEVSTANPVETFEHYSDLVNRAIEAASYEGDHPAVSDVLDRQDLMEELAGEMGDDIGLLLEAGMDEEEAVATTTFYTGAAYGQAQDVEDVGGIAHGAVEIIPEHSDTFEDKPPMEGQHYFEQGAEDHQQIYQEIKGVDEPAF